ncbi:hypothetical protein [Sulfurimonas sp.]|jgi:tetratricopeptide (TPR) repeat protein|uniref:tetratricopeptide repeat protein n=1 Tax=Sulfurimonas sp. TaxID=2022749 RepID=UPI0025D1CA22|nr:hypothetical protein [Sulfurimonas sp.]MCK9473372.1 hypothetical protein [Sulfurimonas sp.]MDD3505541.1 hypothetical protein [Sulfurimonas sp.]
MYNFLKSSFFVAAIMLLGGCSFVKSPEVKGSQKVFEEEDLYILSALALEDSGDHNNSSNIFNTLYLKTGKNEYLYRSLRNDLAANQNERVISRADEISGDKIEDFELIRIKIIALIRAEKLVEAKELAIRLVASSNSENDYLLLSDIYVKLKQYDTALKYLEGAYIKDYNEKILEKIAVVLYVNLERKKDAIAQLETHSRIHGCSKFICTKLIGFYSNDNNVDGLLSTYLRLYKIDPHNDIGEKIVQIYGYKKEYLKMIEFLEENKINNEILFQLYIQTKKYKKAVSIAKELYEDSGDITYLAQSAIFEYESSENKSDKAMHKSVVAKLQEVIKTNRDGMYLNYLGYLLIDHDIDVKKGIAYIKEALKGEPNSIYYLDSLAWGYYKLGDCQRAAKIMKKVQNSDGSSNEDVLKHIEAIKECVKNKKGKN